MKPDPNGQPAHTTWKVMGRGDGVTWLALEPLTGRTHQLRVHCAEMGWPMVGDNIYGTAPRTGGPVLHLHSREVVVPLYKNKDAGRRIAPVPGHMRERLKPAGGQKTDSVELRLVPFRRFAVIFLAAELALAEFGDDGAGGRQALAVDLGRRVP